MNKIRENREIFRLPSVVVVIYCQRKLQCKCLLSSMITLPLATPNPPPPNCPLPSFEEGPVEMLMCVQPP